MFFKNLFIGLTRIYFYNKCFYYIYVARILGMIRVCIRWMLKKTMFPEVSGIRVNINH